MTTRWLLIGMLALGCSGKPDPSGAVAQLLANLGAADDYACGACVTCAGDACRDCLLQINAKNGEAMVAALPTLGSGQSLEQVTSFDQLALPPDAKRKVAELAARGNACYATIRQRAQTHAP